VVWIFAALANVCVPDELLIDPPVAVTLAVMLMAPAPIAPLTKASDPKTTLRPALSVIKPNDAVTVLVMVMSPKAVAELIDTVGLVAGDVDAPLMAALMMSLRPALKVTVLNADVMDALTVKSPTAVVDVIEIEALALIVPPTITVLPACKTIVPSVDVIVPLELVIKSALVTPVAAVKDTFIPAEIAALMLKLRPDDIVTVPNAELTAAEMVMSPTAPVVVKLTLP